MKEILNKIVKINLDKETKLIGLVMLGLLLFYSIGISFVSAHPPTNPPHHSPPPSAPPGLPTGPGGGVANGTYTITGRHGAYAGVTGTITVTGRGANKTYTRVMDLPCQNTYVNGVLTSSTVPSVPLNLSAPSPSTSGGGGGSFSGTSGCSAGTYYCELVRKCIPLGTMCNAGIFKELFVLNPNIKADLIGPVSLKSLNAVPSIGNSGYTCVIDWSKDTFKSYDYLTECTFTSGAYSITFPPGSLTAPTSHSVTNIQKDTSSKMTCRQVDTGESVSKEAVCRVNWKSTEVN